MADAVGARTDHPVNPAHQDLLVHLVTKALQAVQEAPAEMATVARQVPQVLQAILVHQVDKVRLVIGAKMQLVDKKATPDPLVFLAAQVDPALTPIELAPLAEMEDPAHLVHPGSLVQAVFLAQEVALAHQVQEAHPARMPNIVRALIARRPKPSKPKPRPKRKPRPKPKPRRKPENDMVKIILPFVIYLPCKFINTQMQFIFFKFMYAYDRGFLGF